jgi:hypothetical protein
VRLADLHVRETGILQHLLPVCARQATGNSGGPEVNVLGRRLRYRLAVGDVGKL